MGKVWLVITAMAFTGCGRTAFLTPQGDGGGGQGDPPGTDAATTAAGGAAPTGGDAAAGAGGGVPADDCLATCCDGATVHGAAADAQACLLGNGLACAQKGGPLAVRYAGDLVWQSEGACPTMRPCEVNCCSGAGETPGDQFDVGLCAQLGAGGEACGDEGGTARVTFDEHLVFQSLICDGTCQTRCCDGTVAYSDEPTVLGCELRAAGLCGEAEGGPTTVALDGILLWTAGKECPSLAPCLLSCVDGEQHLTQQFQEDVCIALALNSPFCAGHGGPAIITFQGQSVWKKAP